MPETVYLTTAQKRSKGAFHTDPFCERAPNDMTEWDREVAESRGYRECKYCADDLAQPETRQKSLRKQIKDGEIEV